jgi:Cu/Ag efflux pump CusA
MAIMQEIETKLQKGISVSTDEEVYYALLELVKDKAEKIIMKKNTYIKMTAPFRENNRAARKLELINKICTYLVFITYPVYVLYLCFTAGHMLALSIIAPLVGSTYLFIYRGTHHKT